MSETSDTRVYKILSAPDWQRAETLGYTETALDQGDGYVHLSTRAQVAETLTLHYKDQSDVRLLEYALKDLHEAVKWEESRSGQLFPHLHGLLELRLAKRIWTLGLNDQNIPALPGDIDA